MSNFVENGFVEDGFVENDTNLSINIDYDKIFKYIDSSLDLNNKLIFSYLDNNINSSLSSFNDSINNNYIDFLNKINILDSKINNLENKLTLDENIFDLSPSLNGSYGTFKDNSYVTSSIFPVKLKVLSSSFVLNEENNYIIIYKLENEEGNIIFIPNVFISVYVEEDNGD